MNEAKTKKRSPRGWIVLAVILAVLVAAGAVLWRMWHRCGDHVTWSFDRKTGELVLKGEGPMRDFDYEDGRTTAPWRLFAGGITSVVVEEGVTSIGENAFMDCAGLTRVQLPDSLESIGQDAFEFCDCLYALDLPAGLTELSSAFWGTPIQALRIPAGVTELQGGIFDGMGQLGKIEIDPGNPNYTVVDGAVYTADMTTLVRFPPAMACERLTVPEGVTEIGSCGFRFCENLEAVTLPESLTTLGWAAFEDCYSLWDVNIPAGVTELPEDAFEDCGALGSFTVPGTVRTVGSYALAWMEAEHIEIEEGVESIGQSAFTGNYDMTSITLPASLTSLGRYSFDSCQSLTDVYFGGTVSQWTELAGSQSFDSEYGVTVWCSDGEYYG